MGVWKVSYLGSIESKLPQAICEVCQTVNVRWTHRPHGVPLSHLTCMYEQ